MNARFITIAVYCFSFSVLLGQTLTRQQEVVAMTILGEARGEGKRGMYAVASVIAQRSIAWGKTAQAVCLQRKQFSCWNTSNKNRAKLRLLLNTPEAAYAKQLAIHLQQLNRKWIGNADHYCTLRTRPYWAKGKKPTATIGNHKFYKLR